MPNPRLTNNQVQAIANTATDAEKYLLGYAIGYLDASAKTLAQSQWDALRKLGVKANPSTATGRTLIKNTMLAHVND